MPQTYFRTQQQNFTDSTYTLTPLLTYFSVGFNWLPTQLYTN